MGSFDSWVRYSTVQPWYSLGIVIVHLLHLLILTVPTVPATLTMLQGYRLPLHCYSSYACQLLGRPSTAPRKRSTVAAVKTIVKRLMAVAAEHGGAPLNRRLGGSERMEPHMTPRDLCGWAARAGLS